MTVSAITDHPADISRGITGYGAESSIRGCGRGVPTPHCPSASWEWAEYAHGDARSRGLGRGEDEVRERAIAAACGLERSDASKPAHSGPR